MRRMIGIILIMLLFFVGCGERSYAALTFSGTNVVNHSSATSLDNIDPITILAWVYPTDVTTTGTRILDKDASPGTIGYILFYLNEPPNTSASLNIARNRGGSLYTDAKALSNNNLLTVNKWWFLGGQINTGGGNTDQKLFTGDLTTVVTEIGSYATQTVGSGTPGSDADASLLVGNRGSGDNPWLDRIAWVGIWNRILSLGEIQAQQFHPHVTSGCVLFTHLGFAGTGTQPDWSGNGNSGTVTGATVSDHVPLGPPFGFD